MEMTKVARFRTRVKQLILTKSADENRRISYREVAEKTELSEITISRWASGDVERIELATVKALCDYFDCTFEQLIEYDPKD